MLNLADARLIRLFVDDEPLHLPTARLEHYERAIDFRSGTLDRELVWETPAGKRVKVRSRRLVSLEQRHLAAIGNAQRVKEAAASSHHVQREGIGAAKQRLHVAGRGRHPTVRGGRTKDDDVHLTGLDAGLLHRGAGGIRTHLSGIEVIWRNAPLADPRTGMDPLVRRIHTLG